MSHAPLSQILRQQEAERTLSARTKAQGGIVPTVRPPTVEPVIVNVSRLENTTTAGFKDGDIVVVQGE